MTAILVTCVALAGEMPARPSVLPAVSECCELLRAIVTGLPQVTVSPLRDASSGEDFRFARGGRCAFGFTAPAGASPADRLREALEARGWSPDLRFDADGPNGTAFVMAREGVTCRVEESWDGHVDGEGEGVPFTRRWGEVTCGPDRGSGPDPEAD